jgi:hypothetical protein
MREFSAMRPALGEADVIGAFADEIFVQPGGAFDCGRDFGAATWAVFSLGFALLLIFLTTLLLGVLAMRSPLVEFVSAASVP